MGKTGKTGKMTARKPARPARPAPTAAPTVRKPTGKGKGNDTPKDNVIRLTH